MGSEEPADEGGIFGRPVTTLPESDGLTAAVRRAMAFQRTMTTGTVLRGGLLFLGSALYLPLPLLLGYLLDVGRSVGSGDPAPDFGDWQQLYLRGLGLVAVQMALFVAILLAAALVSALRGTAETSDAVVWLVIFGWLYVLPWSVGVYGHGSWRAFLDTTAWRWVVSPQYLVTALVAAVVLTVGYVVFALSVLTLVGWLFVGFLQFALLAALVGQRYHDYASAHTAGSDSGAAAGNGVVESVAQTVRDALSSGSTAAGTNTGSVGTDGDPAGTPAGADTNPDETEYTRFRERAGHLETEGAIERLEAGDGGRVQFVSLATDEEAAVVNAFERAVGRWEGISGSEGVATVYDRGDDPTPWAAYDPLDGSLRAMGELSPGGVLAVTGAVADAMTTGRRYNIAHGAVRPACVFVERGGGAGPAADRVDAAVGDWELQRELAAVTDTVRLPTHYCAPEQFGDGPTDDRVDVYQLAATAHYALFGRPPFADVERATLADPERSVSWQVPEGWHVTDETVAVFERALATDPAERHDSPREFHRALHQALPEER